MIYDVNFEVVKKINNNIYLFFDNKIIGICVILDLKEFIDYVDYILFVVFIKFMCDFLRDINKLVIRKLYFINVFKGIEFVIFKCVLEIVIDEIILELFGVYVVLIGLFYVEEVIECKFIVLIVVSDVEWFRKSV